MLSFLYLQSLFALVPNKPLTVVCSEIKLTSIQVAALTYKHDQLTEVMVILDMLNVNLLLLDVFRECPYNERIIVLRAIDNLATANMRINPNNALTFAGSMLKTIVTFNSVVASQQVSGELPVQIIHTNFRTFSARLQPGLAIAIEIEVPPRPLLKCDHACASSASIVGPFDEASVEEVAVSMVEASPCLYGTHGASFNSNPVQLMVSRTSATPSRVTFVLAHNQAVLPSPVFVLACATIDASGHIDTNSPDCEMTSFDHHSTTCVCLVPPIDKNDDRDVPEFNVTSVLTVVSITVPIEPL